MVRGQFSVSLYYITAWPNTPQYDVPFAQILFDVPENFEVSPKGQVCVAAQKKCVAGVAELKSSVAAQRWVCRQRKKTCRRTQMSS
jgi:hypothetical protein